MMLPLLAIYLVGFWSVPEPPIKFASEDVGSSSSSGMPLALSAADYQSAAITYDLIVQNTGTSQAIKQLEMIAASTRDAKDKAAAQKALLELGHSQ